MGTFAPAANAEGLNTASHASHLAIKVKNEKSYLKTVDQGVDNAEENNSPYFYSKEKLSGISQTDLIESKQRPRLTVKKQVGYWNRILNLPKKVKEKRKLLLK